MKWVTGHIIDRAFLKSPKPYIMQSLLAAVSVAIILYFVETLTHAAIVAALGSSVFIVFAMPNTISADPRRIIGGHITGLLCGILCYFIFCTGLIGEFFEATEAIRWLPAAISVGLAIFLMSIFNFEHPPAAGTALGIVTHEWSHLTIIFVVVFAISLAIVKILLKNYLKDLYT
ncbi:HPP family protein [Chloroflexota bacterium]